MDGIHDLGGMEGFGPVRVKTGDAAFRDLKTWEKRMWGLARSSLARGTTIDWFRHCVENMVPADYLAFAYFNKWCTTYLVLLVDNGTITQDDIKRGHVENPDPPAAAKTLDDVQVGLLLSNPATENPLFLLVTLEELRGFGAYEQVDRRIVQLPRPFEQEPRWQKWLQDSRTQANAFIDERKRQDRLSRLAEIETSLKATKTTEETVTVLFDQVMDI